MDELQPNQLNAMMGMGLKPDESAAVSGHATNLMGKMINGAENLLPTAGAMVGGIGGAAVGALGGPVGAYAGGVAGSGLGGAAGEAAKEGLQGQHLQAGEIAKQGGINAAFDAVGGPILSAGGKLLSKAVSPVLSVGGKVAAKVGDMFGGGVGTSLMDSASPAAARATKLIQSSAETMTKKEQEAAASRLMPTITGGGKFAASDTEQRAGEMLAGKLSTNPVKNIPIIQNEIATQGRGAEQYLEQNAKPITNAEDYTMFQQKRIESEKYMTPTAVKAYDEQINVFQRVLKDFGDYSTPNYYKALKDFETNVTANLPKGKEALLDEGGSARLQAAKDVRSIVRDMIGQKNPEFKGKMFDIASLYDAQDTNIAKALKVDSFAKRHPYLKAGLKYAGYGAAGAVGFDAANEAKNLTGL